MIDADAALAYLDFVAERHRVWQQRQRNDPQPWTDDPILASRKFTNVYRVLDPGSQFVVTDLAPESAEPRDVLARLFLYRYTNLPDTWRHIHGRFGDYPTEADILEEHWVVDTIKDRRDFLGLTVFSGAYVILPQPNRSGDKVEQAVHLAADFMREHADDFLTADTQKDRFDILRSLYGVGEFMAMQILTDWGYTPQCGEDREDEYVVLGPGAVKGAKAIAPGWKPYQTFEWAVAALANDYDCPELQDRTPSWMDIQNTLCEFSKYARYAARGPSPQQLYRPAHPGAQLAPTLPAHW